MIQEKDKGNKFSYSDLHKIPSLNVERLRNILENG